MTNSSFSNVSHKVFYFQYIPKLTSFDSSSWSGGTKQWHNLWILKSCLKWHCSAALAPHIRVRNATHKCCRAIPNNWFEREWSYYQCCDICAAGIPISTVKDVWRRYREDGSVKDRPRSGRPRKSSQRQDRSLLRMARRNRMLSSARLRRHWMRLLRYPISSATVRHRLRRGGYRAYSPVESLCWVNSISRCVTEINPAFS